MKLALVLYGSLDTLSGGYLYDRMLVQHLRAHGDTINILSLPWRNYAVHLTQNITHRLRYVGYEAVLQDELNHPSLFLSNRFAGARHAMPLRLSIVHHLRSSEQHPAIPKLVYRLVETAYLRTVDGFIFNSHTTQRTVERLVGNGCPSVTGLPGGGRLGPPLDPNVIRQRAARGGPLRLVFVGNLIPRKGLHTLLAALAQLPSGWQLSVVGRADLDSRYASEIVQQAARLPAVKLLGPLPDAELAAQLSESDVLVVPSTYEGFGIVYLEGMAFGLPAIATTAGAAGEIITHGRDGFLIAPSDSAALAAHIRALGDDRELLLNLSLAARERFDAHPTWEQSMAAVRGFIQKMVSHRSGG